LRKAVPLSLSSKAAAASERKKKSPRLLGAMASRHGDVDEGPTNGHGNGSGNGRGSSGGGTGNSSVQIVLEKAAEAIAAASKQLTSADLPRLLSLLSDEMAFIARRLVRERPPPTSYRDVALGGSGSKGNNKAKKQEFGEGKRAGSGGEVEKNSKRHDDSTGGWQRVPTAKERHQQRMEKLQHRFPDRPLHLPIDYNPSACQPGCFYHEEDKTKHDHRELRDTRGRVSKRGILGNPAAAKLAPVPSPSGSSGPSGSRISPPGSPLAVQENKGESATENKTGSQQQPFIPEQKQGLRYGLVGLAKRPRALPATPAPLAGKRGPSTPGSPQEAPKKHQTDSDAIVVAPGHIGSLPVPALLAKSPTHPPASGQSSPIHD